jgi:hypothetical protein
LPLVISEDARTPLILLTVPMIVPEFAHLGRPLREEKMEEHWVQGRGRRNKRLRYGTGRVVQVVLPVDQGHLSAMWSPGPKRVMTVLRGMDWDLCLSNYSNVEE